MLHLRESAIDDDGNLTSLSNQVTRSSSFFLCSCLCSALLVDFDVK